jgi:hypothetical protein
MDSSITPEQALLAVQAAGLDPGKPLNEQLGTPAVDDQEALTARVAELEAQLAAAPQQPQDPEREFAERFATKLHDAQTPWFSYGGTDAA